MAISKVILNGETQMDVTQDTVTPETLILNRTATAANGLSISGTLGTATTESDGLMSSDDKIKLNGIAAGAEVNVQSNWNQTTTTADDYIKNKPTNLSQFTNDLTTINNHTVNSDVPSGAVFTDTTYSAGTGLSLSGTTFNHSNSITAGTAGTSSATSGSTLAVPYVTYDAQGHITAKGTHTHTVTGFLTEHQTIKQDGVTGATANRFGTCGVAAGTAAKTVSITSGTFALEAGARVTVKFTYANTASNPTLNVASTSAKNIYHNGARITTGDNKALLAGVCDFVYDGTQYHLVGNYIDTDTTYTAATATPSMDGTGAVGTSDKYAREDHVHPSDTSRVPTSRTVNGKALSSNITLSASDVSAIATSAKGAANGVAELDASGLVPTSQLPSYVDDVLEYTNKASFPTTGETGKIYVDKATNLTYRWSGSAYVEISPSLALGTTSSTAFRGDYGNTAYTHAVTNKGSAFASGLYKITTNSEGHVTAATAVQKSDITGLGIPGSDTNTTYGLSISGHKISLVEGGSTDNVTVPDDNTTYTFAGGTNKFTVTPSGGTAQDVTITPSITNNVTGSGTSGSIAKFNGANTVTDGPALGSSTTTYLRNDGEWATPPDTTYSLVGAQNTTGLVKNGSSVSDATGLTPCPIVEGIPYYQGAPASIFVTASVPTASWTASDSVYSQTVTATGVTAEMNGNIMIDIYHDPSATVASWTNQTEAYGTFGATGWATTGADSVTLNCLEQPAYDFSIVIKSL